MLTLPEKHIMWLLKVQAIKLQHAIDCHLSEIMHDSSHEFTRESVHSRLARLTAVEELADSLGVMPMPLVSYEIAAAIKESYLWLVDNPDGEPNEHGS